MRPKAPIVWAALCMVAVLGEAARPARAGSVPAYAIMDIGPADGASWSQGTAIGSSGLITGIAPTGRATQAFLGLPSGSMVSLGSLVGPQGTSIGRGINGAGVVVGGSDYQSGMIRAFRSDGGSMSDLGTLSGGSWSEAVAINDANQIAGTGNRADGRTVAFRIGADGSFTDLGMIDGGLMSRAFGINALGQVVGESIDRYGISRAFFYDDGKGMIDLGTIPGGGGAVARAINNDGLITGTATDSSGRDVAFIGTAGEPLAALGVLPGGSSSFGLAINNRGEVVGRSAGGSGSRAFLWSAEDGMVNLNQLIDPESGWILDVASGINDSGMIVGTGRINGVSRAFLLTPLGSGSNGPGGGPIGPLNPPGSGNPNHHVTPEPGSIVLALLGAGGLGSVGWIRRRRKGRAARLRSG